MARKILGYTWVVVGIAALYSGYRFLSRWQDNQRIEQKTREKDAESARKKSDLVGGGELKIMQFYAIPGVLSKGQTAKLCYGVANAKSVTIEPETERVWPALSRCIEIAPKRDTEYTLKAEDGVGHSVTETAKVEIRR